MNKEQHGIKPETKPSGDGCVECLASDGWWFHLRRCAECGHIGCCDSSPGQHATNHYKQTGHHIMVSFEPDDDWAYDYKTKEMLNRIQLAPPETHPTNQPVPGPAGKVPRNWQSLLRE